MMGMKAKIVVYVQSQVFVYIDFSQLNISYFKYCFILSRISLLKAYHIP